MSNLTQGIFNVNDYFSSIDSNNDGFVSKKELSIALTNNGIPVTPALVSAIFEEMDINNDG